MPRCKKRRLDHMILLRVQAASFMNERKVRALYIAALKLNINYRYLAQLPLTPNNLPEKCSKNCAHIRVHTRTFFYQRIRLRFMPCRSFTILRGQFSPNWFSQAVIAGEQTCNPRFSVQIPGPVSQSNWLPYI